MLYLGRLAEAKGVRLLMAAWDEVAAGGGAGVPLVIAGTGPLEKEVTAWAAGRDDVRYVGLLDPAECRKAIARSVAVVAPSTWLEAFGLVVVEAMAAGVPTVAAGHGAFVELVEDGVTGLLHRPGEPASLASCIRRIAAEPTRNREMGQAARRRYEQGFSPAVGLERLLEEYRTAIAGRSALARGGDTRAGRGWGEQMTRCRLCGSEATTSVVDLGATPPCESCRGPTGPAGADVPAAPAGLHRLLARAAPPLITPEETFKEYAYFSSFSTSWVEHARTFVDGAVQRLDLGPDAFVVEVASNDGYLLRHVVDRGIRCLGIEPSVNVGAAAREAGCPRSRSS